MYALAGLAGMVIAGVGYHHGAHYKPVICLGFLSFILFVANL